MPKRHFAKASVLYADTSTVPRVASSSFWHSLIPKAFRRPDDPVSVAERRRAKAAKSKDWNPATFFIAMAILIGSNAIQSIALRNERLKFTRRTDAKIALLRETIERVRSGEDVDVEKVLGTGEPEKEQAWEEVMREIESDDALWPTKKRKREQRAQQQHDIQQQSTSDLSFAQLPSTLSRDHSLDTRASPDIASNSSPRRPGFY
ncbi:hypothetical protein BDV97DRAFT_292030 [Delphinella strobiligena]|nr:hypothetical protein BDV97DRAFT_292030 [Delphinella strobiligena]